MSKYIKVFQFHLWSVISHNNITMRTVDKASDKKLVDVSLSYSDICKVQVKQRVSLIINDRLTLAIITKRPYTVPFNNCVQNCI